MCTKCNVLNRESPDLTSDFSARVLDMMNHGALCLMVSLGHRTGLFDSMADMEPATSEDIAKRANLNERYVREWLGAMVTGGIVQFDARGKLYHLPPAHARVLARAAGSDNIATLAQYIPLLGSVEDHVLECFQNGGGVPYERFGRFHEVMADDSGQSVLPALFEHILPLVPDLTARLERGASVLDLGCGQGRALLLMAESFPASTFRGYDISPEAIGWAQTEAARRGLTNVTFASKDAAHLDDRESYDVIFTFDAIHDQAAPQKVLMNIRRALRQGGVYLMQDIGVHSAVEQNLEHPIAPFIYTISCMHCMTVSLAANGDGLGAAWGVELAERMVRQAGFESVEIHRLPHDIQNAYFVMRV